MKNLGGRRRRVFPWPRGILIAVLLIFPLAASAQANAPAAPTAAPNKAKPIKPLAAGPDLTTTQGHLDAARKALEQAQKDLNAAGTANKGGLVEQARSDLSEVLADVQRADDYVTANPGINPLPQGPAPAEAPELRPDTLPPITGAVNLDRAVTQLNTALSALVNNTALDYHGPVLGAIGGFRQKIIAGILKTGVEVHAAEDYAEAHPPPKTTTGTASLSAAAANEPLSEDTIKLLVIITGDISTGTGFIAKMHKQFFMVTNQHVLSGNKKITITGMDGTKYPTTGALYGATDYDVAILAIPESLAKYYLEIMDDPQGNAKVGDAVTVPGNSLGMDVPLQINGKLLGIGPALVEVDAKFVPGNSGSPIIDRTSGQVIGIATLTVTYNQDTITKYGLTSNTRWFGYRLDNIDPASGWQKLDWARFSAEGVKLEAITILSNTMIAILTNKTPPVMDDVHIRNAVEELKSDVTRADQQNSKLAFIEAYKDFHLKLHNIATTDLHDLASQPLYPYHAKVLKQLQDLQTALDAAYANISTKSTP